MKWTIIFLVILGLVASLCVVLLVNAFRADSSLRAGRGEIPVVVMARDLPAWTTLTSGDIQLSKVQKSEAPAGIYNNPALVVGMVVSTDMVEGQILTKSQIKTQGGPADIAADLAPGMRAVSVTLSRDQISGGLLYPRCFVDVLASFKLTGSYRNTEIRGEALATTLLERVRVLAIGGDPMLGTSDKEGKEPVRGAGSQRLTVTLELDSKQAEALQLATDNGTISLALRSPLDTQPVNPEATVLNRGKLSALGTLLGTQVNPTAAADTNGSETAPMAVDATFNTPVPKRSHWEVTVIRGNKVESEQIEEK